MMVLGMNHRDLQHARTQAQLREVELIPDGEQTSLCLRRLERTTIADAQCTTRARMQHREAAYAADKNVSAGHASEPAA